MTAPDRSPEPKIEYERGPCPTCGARTEIEAMGRCTPSSDETGEYYCAAGEPDAQGFFTVPTAASEAANVAWWKAHGIALMEEAEAEAKARAVTSESPATERLEK